MAPERGEATPSPSRAAESELCLLGHTPAPPPLKRRIAGWGRASIAALLATTLGGVALRGGLVGRVGHRLPGRQLFRQRAVTFQGGGGGGDDGLLGEKKAGSMQLLTDERDTRRPVRTTFYMYRAQGDRDYPFENVNAADLPGVMWYLHNEVIPGTPRKYNVTRILRYKVTTMPTREQFEQAHTQFAAFVAFDNGKCTVPGCDATMRERGYNIGCQLLNPEESLYMSPFQTKGRCRPGKDCPGIWYSVPGPCPSQEYMHKDDACKAASPGGACPSVTGSRTCTYHYEKAGEVRLDELSGIRHYTKWWRDGNREYDYGTDRGIGCTFWDGKKDWNRCQWRQNKVQKLFREKYPHMPVTYGEPPCNFS
mmetsp:Transcript_3813/g.10852  ORF Transcript_3813/g.10852 Transcript_3813/m.10852 type:complete len:366 (+) Transcript_3813:43-1140(+)